MAKKGEEVVDVEVLVQRDDPSRAAVLVKSTITDKGAWLPRSMIELEYTKGAWQATVTLPTWLAKEKELI